MVWYILLPYLAYLTDLPYLQTCLPFDGPTDANNYLMHMYTFLTDLYILLTVLYVCLVGLQVIVITLYIYIYFDRTKGLKTVLNALEH